MSRSDYVIDSFPVKKLLLLDNPKILTNEGLEAAIFLLKRFLAEARYRTSGKTKFDTDNDGRFDGNKRGADDDIDDPESIKRMKLSGKSRNYCQLGDSTCSDNNENNDDPVLIRARYVLEMSAEMLMDFE